MWELWYEEWESYFEDYDWEDDIDWESEDWSEDDYYYYGFSVSDC